MRSNRDAHRPVLIHLVACSLFHPFFGEAGFNECALQRDNDYIEVSLLQRNFHMVSSVSEAQDLVFMQQPNCHGHTVIMLGAQNGLLWGKLNPSLAAISNVTGCHMWYTPQKYWPEELARSYFGDKQVFGTLRNPYDRMANQFRYFVTSQNSQFPVHYKEYFQTCNVNAFLEEELPKLVVDPYKDDCHWTVMSEYFDMPHGITVAFDNRRIPWSLNELLQEHGYDFQEAEGEALLNQACNNIWAGSLNDNVKAMIKEIYARDFKRLCSLWGYCDPNELTCHSQFNDMCGDAPDFIKNRPYG